MNKLISIDLKKKNIYYKWSNNTCLIKFIQGSINKILLFTMYDRMAYSRFIKGCKKAPMSEKYEDPTFPYITFLNARSGKLK